MNAIQIINKEITKGFLDHLGIKLTSNCIERKVILQHILDYNELFGHEKLEYSNRFDFSMVKYYATNFEIYDSIADLQDDLLIRLFDNERLTDFEFEATKKSKIIREAILQKFYRNYEYEPCATCVGGKKYFIHYHKL